MTRFVHHLPRTSTLADAHPGEDQPLSERWGIYDSLLAQMQGDARVEAYLVGKTRTLVKSAYGVGMATTFRPDGRQAAWLDPGGLKVGELAGRLKSWDLREASLGLAALNSFTNSAARVEEWLGRTLSEVRSESVFSSLAGEIHGKRVAVVGHFPAVAQICDHCELTILERRPEPGDLPDFAAEYVLPLQDYVFITGTALTNKTLPRLLELSCRARVVLVGPSVPVSPVWFDWGVDVLAGSVVTDGPAAWEAVQGDWQGRARRSGTVMVQVRRGDLPRNPGAYCLAREAVGEADAVQPGGSQKVVDLMTRMRPG